ncbi:MAG: RsmE family RNA methyltransferase [Myxococcales bacterium]|nr:RsmE family RNA methyltransferase [Myxococcales bacterium]
MNLLLLLPDEQLTPGRFIVEGSRADHLLQVLRVKRDTHLHVGLRNGPRGSAVVLATKNRMVELEATFESNTPPRPTTKIIVGISRPKVLKRLIPQLVSFGLDELVLLRTWRVERSYLLSDCLDPKSLKNLVWEGLMQGCLTHETKIRVEKRFLPYVDEHLACATQPGFRWVAHPRAQYHIGELALPTSRPRTLAIGPERGFLDQEVESLICAGFIAARIAGPILRVDTACIAALAQLELRSAQLSASVSL